MQNIKSPVWDAKWSQMPEKALTVRHGKVMCFTCGTVPFKKVCHRPKLELGAQNCNLSVLPLRRSNSSSIALAIYSSMQNFHEENFSSNTSTWVTKQQTQTRRVRIRTSNKIAINITPNRYLVTNTLFAESISPFNMWKERIRLFVIGKKENTKINYWNTLRKTPWQVFWNLVKANGKSKPKTNQTIINKDVGIESEKTSNQLWFCGLPKRWSGLLPSFFPIQNPKKSKIPSS